MDSRRTYSRPGRRINDGTAELRKKNNTDKETQVGGLHAGIEIPSLEETKLNRKLIEFPEERNADCCVNGFFKFLSTLCEN